MDVCGGSIDTCAWTDHSETILFLCIGLTLLGCHTTHAHTGKTVVILLIFTHSSYISYIKVILLIFCARIDINISLMLCLTHLRPCCAHSVFNPADKLRKNKIVPMILSAGHLLSTKLSVVIVWWSTDRVSLVLVLFGLLVLGAFICAEWRNFPAWIFHSVCEM